MKRYIVGGWVRDTLLGKDAYSVLPSDKDWVVVGSTPEEMLASGYLPVGADFPVFLHPKTHEEFALARTERKTAPGYRGFVFHAAPSVTLEQDLFRRDLTINAMAMDEQGNVIDPYNGRFDLKAKVLRHVSYAFVEDPVRILRLARFAARYPDFSIAEETYSLMVEMINKGEADALVAERVFQEFSKGLQEKAPSRMIEVLEQIGFVRRLFPKWKITKAVLEAVDIELTRKQRLNKRFALMFCATAPDEVALLMKSLKTPSDIRDLTMLLVCNKDSFLLRRRDPEKLLDLLEKVDAIRRPERFDQLLQTVSLIEKTIDVDLWKSSLRKVLAVDAGSIAKRQTEAKFIPLAIRKARLESLSVK